MPEEVNYRESIEVVFQSPSVLLFSRQQTGLYFEKSYNLSKLGLIIYLKLNLLTVSLFYCK